MSKNPERKLKTIGELKALHYKMNKILESVKFGMSNTTLFKPMLIQLFETNVEFIYTNDMKVCAMYLPGYNGIVINMAWFEHLIKDSDKFLFASFLLIHEISHIMFMHHLRENERDHTLWNKACDYFIHNTFLDLALEEEIIDLNGILFNSDYFVKMMSEYPFLYDDKFKGKTEDEIYEILLDGAIKEENDMNDNGEGDTGNGSSQSFVLNDGKNSKLSEYLNKNNLGNDKRDDCSDTDEINEESLSKHFQQFELDYKKFSETDNSTEAEGIKGDSDENINSEDGDIRKQPMNISNMLLTEAIKSIGDENNPIKKIIGKSLGLKVDWKVVIRHCLESCLDKSDDYGWSSIRLTSFVMDMYLPGKVEKESRDTLFLAVDESASMEDHDLRKALDIVYNLKDKFKNLLVIKHDTKISWEKEYTDLSETSTSDIIDDLSIRRTCGGTSHVDIFKRAVEYDDENENSISGILLFSDGESDIEKCHQITNKPKIILNTGDDKIKGIKNVFVE